MTLRDFSLNEKRYVGKVCAKHPNLQGVRLKSNCACVGCHYEKGERRRQSPEVREQDRLRALEWYRVKAADPAFREARNERLRAKWATDEKYRQKGIADQRKYFNLNRGKFKAYRLARADTVSQRTPKWANFTAINVIYAEARCLGLTVDHYYPLHGKTVSGLHVAENLRIIPQSENDSKGNKHPDDFYGEK